MAFFDFLQDDQDEPKAPALPLPKVGEKLKIGGTEATVVDEPAQDDGVIISQDLSKTDFQGIAEANLQDQVKRGRQKIDAMMTNWRPQDQTPGSEAQGRQIEGAIKVQKQLEEYAKKAKENDGAGIAQTIPDQKGAKPGALQTAQPQVEDQTNTFVAKGGVKDLWSDLGIPDEAMVDKLNKGMTALAKVMPGVTFGSPVSNFYAGLATVTRALGPKAVQGVYGKLMQEMQKPERGYDQEAKRLEGKAAESDKTYESDYQSLKKAARELAQSDGLNNFGSIMLFVLTSMVIGPKLAILFFADKAKRGELAVERDEIAMRMETNRRRGENYREMSQAARMKSIGVNVEEKQMMKREMIESWNRFNVERMRLKARSASEGQSREMKRILETAKKLEFAVGKDLRSATDLERDATETERNVGDKAIIQKKREQAAQLRNRAELNMDRHHTFLLNNGLAEEDDAGTEAEE